MKKAFAKQSRVGFLEGKTNFPRPLRDTSRANEFTSCARLRACERSESQRVSEGRERGKDVLLPRQGQELPTSLRVVQILFACGRGARGGWNNLREIGTHPNPPSKGREKRAAFTKPSRAASAARDEQASTEALSFRCNCERRRLMRGAVPAFTLAEVLITLAIIGVVAAMTIPTLIAKINDIVNTNTVKVFNSKVLKGINLTKTAGDLNDTYDSTYQFLTDALSKNLKMAKICDADHIRDCIPYDKIKYDKNGTETTLDVKDIKTASKLKLPAPYTDTAAFVLGDGTPVIVAYNTKCIDDPDKAYTSLTDGCLAGVFDINGSRKPNKFGSKVEDGKTVYTGDLRTFNGAKIGNCAGVIGDVCIASTAKMANASLVAEIQAVDPSYTLPKTSQYNWDDYWQLANDYCEKIGGGHLPDSTALAKIANALYGVDNISTADSYNSNSSLSWDANKDTVFAALGITDNPSWFSLWSSSPNGTEYAYRRSFNSSDTDYYDRNRRGSNLRVVCLGS